MTYSALAALLAATAMTGLASAAGAATITNGSFEVGPAAANGYFAELGFGDTQIAGWTVGGNSIDYINPSNPYWVAQDGTRALDLSGSAPGSISQTLDTVAGQSYTVSFYMAGNPDGAPSTKAMSVDINGLGVQNYSFDASGVVSYANLGWTLETYTFVATGTSSVLTFTDLNTGSPYGAALDNVSISAGVPEPASWALMIGGFGLAGSALRRRRALAVAA